jgi:hypothetical protein
MPHGILVDRPVEPGIDQEAKSPERDRPAVLREFLRDPGDFENLVREDIAVAGRVELPGIRRRTYDRRERPYRRGRSDYR